MNGSGSQTSHDADAVAGPAWTTTLGSFYRGKRVLVTGHTGFKGTWMTHWLAQMGAEVVGFALTPNTTPSMFELTRADRVSTSILGDLRDADAVAATFAAHRPEIVLHMGAQPLVRRSYGDPLVTFATNVMGTANVLDGCLRADTARAVVVVTSDKCYEARRQPRPYRETDALGGHDPYSASKACAELVTSSYRSSFFRERGVGVASARAGNAMGGGDWAEDRLIPDIIRGVASGGATPIRSPMGTRPWQHVIEAIGGYLLLAKRLFEEPGPFSEGWNFGPDASRDEVTTWTVASRVVAQLGRGTLERREPTDQRHEARFLSLDSTKARTRLGWRPKLDLDLAIALTASWYARFLRGEDAEKITAEQIAGYAA